MLARRVPTATVESTGTSIERRTPAAGDGISVSTLSVETSSSASSTATESPTFFNQRVTVPSVTLSPNAGITTGVAFPLGCGTGAGAAGAAAIGAGAAGAGVAATGAAATGAGAAGAAGVAFAESFALFGADWYK